MADEVIQAINRLRVDLATELKDFVREENRRLEKAMQTHFDGIYAGLGRLDSELQSVKSGLRRVEERLDQIEQRLTNVEARLDQFALASEVAQLRNEVAGLKQRIAELEGHN